MKMPNVTKLLNNKLLQQGAGAYMHLSIQSAQTGTPVMQIVENIANAAITNPHIPSFQAVLDDLTKGWAKPLMIQLVKLYGVGYLAKETKLSTKWGNLLTNFAKNAAKGAAITSVVTQATIHGSGELTVGNPILEYM